MRPAEIPQLEHGVCIIHDCVSPIVSLLRNNSPDRSSSPPFKIEAIYDYDLSTESNYEDNSKEASDLAIDEFEEIRRTIDGKWHRQYCPRRIEWQNAIIQCLISKQLHSPADNIFQFQSPTRWLIYTSGAMGAGKSYCMRWMMRHGFLHLPHMVAIDPDWFKRQMPEWRTYVKHSPSTAGSLTHKESALLVEICLLVVLQRNHHVWVDGSLSDFEWYRQSIAAVRAAHPNYKVAILHVSASDRNIRHRTRIRGQVTGRIVPDEIVEKSIARSIESVHQLRNSVDFVALIRNDAKEPFVKEIIFPDSTAATSPPPKFESIHSLLHEETTSTPVS